MPTKQDIAKIERWKQDNTELIKIRPRKELNLIARMERAIDAGAARSRQEYVTEAIIERLERDGF